MSADRNGSKPDAALAYFAVWATDKPGTQALRQRLRPNHRAWLRHPQGHPVTVCLGGPTLAPNGEMNGTLLVVQADDIETVCHFFDNDPYSLHGLFESVVIRPWVWGLGLPSEPTQATPAQRLDDHD